MAKLKKYNLEGKQVGEVDVSDELANAEANSQMIKDYIIAIRENARQWSANTKGRSEVKHTTKKPHKQKGTGRARQGSLVAPQFKGGGCVFGPKPKFDQHVSIPRKQRKAAIRSLIAEKIRGENLHVLETTDLEAPQTKTMANFLKKCALNKRVLFLGEGNYAEVLMGETAKPVSVKCDRHQNFCKSLNNIPKTAFLLAKNVSGYDVMIAQDIVVTEAALKELNEWLV